MKRFTVERNAGFSRASSIIVRSTSSTASSYQRIRASYVDGARDRPEEFTKRLNRLVEMSARGKQFGYEIESFPETDEQDEELLDVVPDDAPAPEPVKIRICDGVPCLMEGCGHGLEKAAFVTSGGNARIIRAAAA